MKKLAYVIVALVVFLSFGFVIGIPITNNIVAKNITKELAELPLPMKTECLEETSLAGKLFGCGNGMQYFGAILVKSQLSLKELQQYYSKYSNEEKEYCVEIQRSNKIEIIEHGSLSFDEDIEGEGYYMIYTVECNEEDILDMDLRGH